MGTLSLEERIKEDIQSSRDLSTLKYREWFQENKISHNFSPWIHPLFNFCVLTATIFFGAYKVSNWNITLAFAGLATLLAGNLVVFLLHRYPLHRRYKLSSFPYDRHTVQHHRYYDYRNIVLSGARDFEVIFFPWFIIAGFVAFVCPVFFFLGNFLIDDNLGWFLVMASSSYFTLYEIVHLSCHLETDHWFLRIPGLKAMHEHHRLHHHPRLMNKYNFCIVYPLFDYIMGTKYKGEVPEPDIQAHAKNVLENL